MVPVCFLQLARNEYQNLGDHFSILFAAVINAYAEAARSLRKWTVQRRRSSSWDSLTRRNMFFKAFALPLLTPFVQAPTKECHSQ
jgi:hypothetical protein